MPTYESAGPHGMLRGQFSYQLPRTWQDARGRFVSFQRETAQANAELARKLANSVANALDASLVREPTSKGDLRRALRREGNRFSDRFGFGVGNPRFLDNYATGRVMYSWRHINWGTEAGAFGNPGHAPVPNFIGRRLTGVFSFSRGGPFDPIDPKAPHPGGFGRKFYTIKEAGRGGARSGNPLPSRGTRGVINRPIKPERYFLHGWEDFEAPRTVADTYRQAFRRAGFNLDFGSGAVTPRGGARAAQARGSRPTGDPFR